MPWSVVDFTVGRRTNAHLLDNLAQKVGRRQMIGGGTLSSAIDKKRGPENRTI